MTFRNSAVLGLVLLIPALSLAWFVNQDQRLQARFKQISAGMSADQVIATMGDPSWDDRCGVKMPTGLPAECAREFGYGSAFGPMFPGYYLVWFGNEGRVIDTAPITSP